MNLIANGRFDPKPFCLAVSIPVQECTFPIRSPGTVLYLTVSRGPVDVLVFGSSRFASDNFRVPSVESLHLGTAQGLPTIYIGLKKCIPDRR